MQISVVTPPEINWSLKVNKEWTSWLYPLKLPANTQFFATSDHPTKVWSLTSLIEITFESIPDANIVSLLQQRVKTSA